MGVIKRRLIVRGEWGLEPHATKPADDDAVELTPTANYGYNKASNLWLPQPVGTSGAPVVEVEEENEYVMKTLALAAAFVATEIKDAGGNPLAGRSLTIWINDGSWNLYFDSGSHDPIPIAPITSVGPRAQPIRQPVMANVLETPFTTRERPLRSGTTATMDRASPA